MGFKCGIVGLPNVGKSSLFNLLSKSQIAKVGNFPFCTISPNTTKVPVKDERIDVIHKMSRSAAAVYANLEIVDIAGLVKGASEGAGLGNNFLENICSVDLIIHVVRCFRHENIVSVLDYVDPIIEIQIIREELIEYDIKRLEKSKTIRDQNLKKEYEKKILNMETVEGLDWKLLSQKPTLILCNGKDPEMIETVKEFANFSNFDCLSIDVESVSANPNNEESKRSLDAIIKKGYEKLNLISYFTTGPQETRAWTIERGTKAPQAAAKIHSDFENKFIKAELITFDNFLSGKKNPVLVGKDYVVNDADILLFKLNK